MFEDIVLQDARPKISQREAEQPGQYPGWKYPTQAMTNTSRNALARRAEKKKSEMTRRHARGNFL